MNESITPLHTWSGYSPLRGPMGLQRLVERAAQLGHARLALTDANNLYGATRFHWLAERAGLREELALMDVRLGELRLGSDRLTAPDSARLALPPFSPERAILCEAPLLFLRAAIRCAAASRLCVNCRPLS